MKLDDVIRIRHMIEAARAVARFVEGRQRADLDGNTVLSFAIVRAIEIFGEAASKVSHEARAQAPGVALGRDRCHSQPFDPRLFRHRPRYCVDGGNSGNSSVTANSAVPPAARMSQVRI